MYVADGHIARPRWCLHDVTVPPNAAFAVIDREPGRDASGNVLGDIPNYVGGFNRRPAGKGLLVRAAPVKVLLP